MIALKRILVATDFGEASEAALGYGRELARTFGAKLTVLHVAENVLTGAIGIDGYVGSYPDFQRSVEESARRQLDAAVTDDDRRELGATTVMRTSTSPAMAIVTYAGDEKIDLIVMGTHGRGPMAHLLMGSVAERVVRIAPCPVLTVKHPEHEFLRPDALVRVEAVSLDRLQQPGIIQG
jgi:nucleotide-binding universal stress UspA family protein